MSSVLPTPAGRLFLAGVLLLSFSWTGCDSVEDDSDFEATEVFAFTVPVQQHTRFRLAAVNGTIAIAAVSGGNEVRVSGTKKVEAGSQSRADDGLALLDVVMSESSQEITARTDQPTVSEGRNYTVDYAIEIPADLDVSVASVNGDVDVVDAGADLTVNLVNGVITASAAMQHNAMVAINLVNGTIALTIPSATSAELTCSVTNGTIATTGLVLNSVTSTPKTLQGTLGAGDGDITLTTVNGTIDVIATS